MGTQRRLGRVAGLVKRSRGAWRAAEERIAALEDELLAQNHDLGYRIRHLEGALDQRQAELAAAHAELDDARAKVALFSPVGVFVPGHYYSPIPAAAEVWAAAETIWADRDALPGLEPMDASRQVALLRSLARAQPKPQAPRYAPENDFFSWGDGLVLRGFLATRRPKRVVEVGSGWSSALILDTRDALPDWQPLCTFVEPYPEDRLNALLRSDDLAGIRIEVGRVQDIDIDVLIGLDAGDLLFIDSTHVSKVGSDVNHLFHEVLPRLAPGVIVHVHDVFWPFEYPRAWLEEGRYWNEDYLLRAFLTGNPSWNVLLFNDWLNQKHHAAAAAVAPDWSRNPGASFWMERTGR